MQNNKGKVLLTGAAGFIGSATARQLRDIGHEVVGVDSLNDAYDPKIKTHRLDSLRTISGFEFLEGDIEDRRFLSSVFSDHDFDIVVNLAARAGVRYSMENPSVYLQMLRALSTSWRTWSRRGSRRSSSRRLLRCMPGMKSPSTRRWQSIALFLRMPHRRRPPRCCATPSIT